MSISARRGSFRAPSVPRPASLTLIGLLGVLFGMALFASEIALAFFRTQRGFDWSSQFVDIAIAAGLAMILIWMFWGVWEMIASAWWSHLLIGPLLVIGALLFSGYAGTVAPFVAHHFPSDTIEQTARVLQLGALVLAVLEIVTIVILLANQASFGIGRKKPLWERVNR